MDKLSQKNKVKLYHGLKKDEVIAELHQRGLSFTCKGPGKDLQTILEYEMHGFQRLPALLFESKKNSENIRSFVSRTFAQYYELHAKDIINNSLNGKEVKNGSDYIKSLLLVSNWLIQFLPDHFVTKLFITMTEILKLFVTMTEILRLSNLVFQHALLIDIYIKDFLVSLTPQKFFGVYYHAIVKHACILYRKIS